MSSQRYEKIKHLGEGQFANVYKAKDNENDEFVAIKKIKLGSRYDAKDGVNRTALREIKLLQELHHDNIIELKDVIGHRTNIQLVFDFMDSDLERLIKDNSVILMPEHIKNMTLQMLLGLEYLHLHWILHRDLKPNNLLMNMHGRIKIADFGLARFFGSPNRVYTHQVVTRWYRAPELLYGTRSYGVGIDIWAVGCIIAELLLRVPIFPGESDIDQLSKISSVLGDPNVDDWPELTSFRDYLAFKSGTVIPLKQVFSAASDDLIELIQQCWHFNPIKRWNATEALNSDYFKRPPYACDDSELPLPSDKVPPVRSRKRRRGVTPTGLASSGRRKLTFED